MIGLDVRKQHQVPYWDVGLDVIRIAYLMSSYVLSHAEVDREIRRDHQRLSERETDEVQQLCGEICAGTEKDPDENEHGGVS